MALALLLFASLNIAKGSFADFYVADQKVDANISEKELENKIHQAIASYKLKLQHPDGKITEHSFKRVGVFVNEKASARVAKNVINSTQTSRLLWWRPINIELVTKTKDEVLQQFISAKATKTKTSPENAKLKIKGDKVKVIKEKIGDGYTVPNAESAIPSAIAMLDSSPLKIVPSKLQPKIFSNDIQSSKRKIEFLISRKVKFNIANHTVTASAKDIAAWLDLNTVIKAKTIDVTINSGKILEYIDNIAAPYIQPPRSKLVFGQTVLDYGADGIDVVNKDQTASDVAKKLPEGRDLTIDLSVNFAKADSVEATLQDKWIVADVTNKRMYAYEKSKLVRTFLISAGAPLTPTVLGTHHIYAKFKSQDMRGANVDGSRYFQPDVPYVNYFYGDYAIHGNYWRPLSYFGNINSSHGCIGITTADSEWIYYWAPIGTTVIVHS